MKIYDNMIDLIGNTPLVKINSIAPQNSNILAKVEYFNPTGSIKDRAAYSMIKDAIDKGIITPNKTTIIEPTSGNTGIGLAMVCSLMGFDLILTMPESMSKERRDVLKAYGAKLELTEASKGMQGAMDKAVELKEQIKDSYIPQQFSNSANPQIHYKTTADEIYNNTDGTVDIVIAGVGTGGTISGIAKKLKEYKPKIKAIAVEPYSSPLISKGIAGGHKIQGIGANFIPDNYDAELVDEVIAVKDEDAINCARKLALKEGLFVGISSGAAMSAACEVALRGENKDKTIVVILPDGGMKYLSSPLFN